MSKKQVEKQVESEVESTLSYTPEQAAEVKARVEGMRVKGRELVIEAARITFGVVSSGMIGKGKVWETQGDYAQALGVSGGTISGLLALGTAMDRGLTEGHRNFEVVYAQRQSIGKAAKDKGHTGFSHIVKAAQVAAKPKPRAVAPASTTDTPTPDTSLYDQTVAALEFIRESLDALTADQSKAVSNSLVTLAQTAHDTSVRTREAEKEAARKTA